MKTKLNIELFKKIRDRIAEVPESYDQSLYIRSEPAAPCGTAACLAGEAIICAAKTLKIGVKNLHFYDNKDRVAERAAELLGLPEPDWGAGSTRHYNDTARLFASLSESSVIWPKPFAEQFRKARDSRERAAVAVKYLDHIIETGKVLE